MKYRLLDLVHCPVCQESLALEVFVEKDEVEEGCLTCEGCARIFPVINGIPRLLPDELANMVLHFNAPFFDRYAGPMSSYLRRSQAQPQDGWWRAQRRTLTSFSYQWRKFKEMIPHWEQVFLDSISPIEPDFFQGKVGLDAGCGFGRPLYYAASYGAEVIGMDLSEAVEAARENTRHLPNVHLIQADIFNPPLRERSLDFVYSIGVLHHLPDPKQGFLALSHLLTHGAPIFIWVTSRGRGRQIALFTIARALTTRLPLRLLDFLCLCLAAGHWVLWLAPFRLLSRFEPTRSLVQRLPYSLLKWFHYARYPFRVLHTDWFDGLSVPLMSYYRREEIAEWFREANLERVRIDPDWRGRALGYVPSSAERPLEEKSKAL